MKAALFQYKVFFISHFSASLNGGNKPILCSIFSSDLTLSEVKNIST